jgi:hypothetical protein
VREPIEEFLEDNGPALSSEVATYLVEHLEMSPVAARKRVSRAAGDVRRLSGITFPHKARFLYLQQQFGSPWYWEHLIDALVATRSAYGYALAALRQRGGIVPARQFPIVCGAPVKQARQLSPDTVFQRLSEAGLLTKVMAPGVGECVALVQAQGYYDSNAELMRARLVTEEILLTAVSDWLKKLGIVSYGKVATRTGQLLPKIGTFVWDLSAPCYLGHMVRQGADGKPKPGFVACDVYLGEDMTAAGVMPFLRKCVMLRSLRKVGPCMQLLVAKRFEHDAFQLLKQYGVIPATPANLFGDEVAEGLNQLTTVLHNAALAVIDPAQFDELFSKLGKIEGAAIQLRGTLFEYLAAEIARRTISPDVKMNRLFKVADKGEAEADVVAVHNHHAITAIECKGYSPWSTIPDALFERWLHHNVPICFREIKQHPDWKTLDVHFEFWATAPLSDKAMALFTKAKKTVKPTRYSLELRLGPDLHALCKKIKDPSLLTAFEKHFMKPEKAPPLAPKAQEAVLF